MSPRHQQQQPVVLALAGSSTAVGNNSGSHTTTTTRPGLISSGQRKQSSQRSLLLIRHQKSSNRDLSNIPNDLGGLMTAAPPTTNIPLTKTTTSSTISTTTTATSTPDSTTTASAPVPSITNETKTTDKSTTTTTEPAVASAISSGSKRNLMSSSSRSSLRSSVTEGMIFKSSSRTLSAGITTETSRPSLPPSLKQKPSAHLRRSCSTNSHRKDKNRMDDEDSIDLEDDDITSALVRPTKVRYHEDSMMLGMDDRYDDDDEQDAQRPAAVSSKTVSPRQSFRRTKPSSNGTNSAYDYEDRMTRQRLRLIRKLQASSERKAVSRLVDDDVASVNSTGMASINSNGSWVPVPANNKNYSRTAAKAHPPSMQHPRSSFRSSGRQSTFSDQDLNNMASTSSTSKREDNHSSWTTQEGKPPSTAAEVVLRPEPSPLQEPIQQQELIPPTPVFRSSKKNKRTNSLRLARNKDKNNIRPWDAAETDSVASEPILTRNNNDKRLGHESQQQQQQSQEQDWSRYNRGSARSLGRLLANRNDDNNNSNSHIQQEKVHDNLDDEELTMCTGLVSTTGTTPQQENSTKKNENGGNCLLYERDTVPTDDSSDVAGNGRHSSAASCPPMLLPPVVEQEQQQQEQQQHNNKTKRRGLSRAFSISRFFRNLGRRKNKNNNFRRNQLAATPEGGALAVDNTNGNKTTRRIGRGGSSYVDQWNQDDDERLETSSRHSLPVRLSGRNRPRDETEQERRGGGRRQGTSGPSRRRPPTRSRSSSSASEGLETTAKEGITSTWMQQQKQDELPNIRPSYQESNGKYRENNKHEDENKTNSQLEQTGTIQTLPEGDEDVDTPTTDSAAKASASCATNSDDNNNNNNQSTVTSNVMSMEKSTSPAAKSAYAFRPIDPVDDGRITEAEDEDDASDDELQAVNDDPAYEEDGNNVGNNQTVDDTVLASDPPKEKEEMEYNQSADPTQQRQEETPQTRFLDEVVKEDNLSYAPQRRQDQQEIEMRPDSESQQKVDISLNVASTTKLEKEIKFDPIHPSPTITKGAQEEIDFKPLEAEIKFSPVHSSPTITKGAQEEIDSRPAASLGADTTPQDEDEDLEEELAVNMAAPKHKEIVLPAKEMEKENKFKPIDPSDKDDVVLSNGEKEIALPAREVEDDRWSPVSWQGTSAPKCPSRRGSVQTSSGDDMIQNVIESKNIFGRSVSHPKNTTPVLPSRRGSVDTTSIPQQKSDAIPARPISTVDSSPSRVQNSSSDGLAARPSVAVEGTAAARSVSSPTTNASISSRSVTRKSSSNRGQPVMPSRRASIETSSSDGLPPSFRTQVHGHSPKGRGRRTIPVDDDDDDLVSSLHSRSTTGREDSSNNSYETYHSYGTVTTTRSRDPDEGDVAWDGTGPSAAGSRGLDPDASSYDGLLSLNGLTARWVEEGQKKSGTVSSGERRTGVDPPGLRLVQTGLPENEATEVQPERLSVCFHRVIIRAYERVLGDNPACTNGPPVSIGWNYYLYLDTSVDDYETVKPVKLKKKDFRLSSSQRSNILIQEWEYTQDDLRKARREVTYIQYCREKSAFSSSKAKEANFLRKANKKLQTTSSSGKRRSAKPSSPPPASESSALSSSDSRLSTPSTVAPYKPGSGDSDTYLSSSSNSHGDSKAISDAEEQDEFFTQADSKTMSTVSTDGSGSVPQVSPLPVRLDL